jgi:hypothetical protein
MIFIGLGGEISGLVRGQIAETFDPLFWRTAFAQVGLPAPTTVNEVNGISADTPKR